jgi:dihydroorotate dehydrogenase
MNFYSLLKPLLFTSDPEKAHRLTLSFLKHTPDFMCASLHKHRISDPTECFGLHFPNKVGLAAGFDKNGEAINALLALGFGFLELGGVTPEPQQGNLAPRMLRIPSYKSLINHLGLNNLGVAFLKEQLKKPRLSGVIGVNIAANKTTPLERAYLDYGHCLNTIYPYCDYISANISCPNVHGKDASAQLAQSLSIAEHLCELREIQKQSIGITKPILIKISPDTDAASLAIFCERINPLSIDGIIGGNTTISRPEVLSKSQVAFCGGLSGELLTPIALNQIQQLRPLLSKDKAIIGVGGIHDSQSAKACMQAGASLIQLYTSLIYEGPCLIKTLAKDLAFLRFQ